MGIIDFIFGNKKREEEARLEIERQERLKREQEEKARKERKHQEELKREQEENARKERVSKAIQKVHLLSSLFFIQLGVDHLNVCCRILERQA